MQHVTTAHLIINTHNPFKPKYAWLFQRFFQAFFKLTAAMKMFSWRGSLII